MKVYVAEGHWEYEGFDILGIFTTRGDAQLFLDKAIKEDRLGDSYKISEHDLRGE